MLHLYKAGVSFICSLLFVCFASAQPVVVATSTNYGLGYTEYIRNSYTGAGEVTNSYEFIPAGFNWSDKTTKYPVIFFFPGAGATKTSDPNSVMWFQREGIGVEIEGANVPSPFRFIVIGMQGTTSSPASDYARFMENYIFVKYKDKIDMSRIYLTGLSLGGGKVVEYMADETRASKIAAIAPIAMANVCPYLADCSGNTVVNNLLAFRQSGVFFTHNVNDPTISYWNSRNYVDRLNASQPGRAQFYFDPNSPLHDAWSAAYPGSSRNFGGTNLYTWFLKYTSSSLFLLPVKLTKFSAKAKDNGAVQLDWATAEEQNSSHFIIERSRDGSQFTELGKVNAAGSSSTERTYSFTDNAPFAGTDYYRLKQVDRDGHAEYSETKKVVLGRPAMQLSVSPNPVKNVMTIEFTGAVRGNVTVVVTDQAGRTVQRYNILVSAGNLQQTVDVSRLMPGIYMVSANIDGEHMIRKIIKQ